MIDIRRFVEQLPYGVTAPYRLPFEYNELSVYHKIQSQVLYGDRCHG